MNRPLKLGILQDIFSTVPTKTEASEITTDRCYESVLPVFHYLSGLQREDGAVYDPYVSSTLDNQYHHACFGLASTILYTLTGDEAYGEKGYAAFKYYMDLPLESKRGGVDFSNFPALLATVILGDTYAGGRLSGLLSEYVGSMVHHSTFDPAHTYGNNFVTLRALNQLLRFKILGSEKDLVEATHYMEGSLKWQFPDGIFYDFPRRFNDPRGIPSLAYHSKITLITLMFGLVSGREDITEKALKGLDALEKLTAPDGEAFYYGRTNNALYGYACAILALRLAASHLSDGERAAGYKGAEKRLLGFISGHRAPDGHLYIVPNNLEEDRCGFDNYMYVTVYNAFTSAMLLLTSLVKESGAGTNAPEEATYYFKDSGFLVRKGPLLSTAMNIKGHNSYEQYLLDPRFTCSTPLFLAFNGRDLLPSIPLTSPIYPDRSGEGAVGKLLRKAMEATREFVAWGYLDDYNPLYAGFMPYIESRNSWYMPLGFDCADVSADCDKVVIKISGRLTAVKRRGIKPCMLFVMSTLSFITGITPEAAMEMMVTETALPFERTITIEDRFIHFSDTFPGPQAGAPRFTLRKYLGGDVRVKDGLFVWTDGDANGETGFALILEGGGRAKVNRRLCSSKGRTEHWVVYPGVHGEKAAGGARTVTLNHTLIPFDATHSLDDGIEAFEASSTGSYR